jgi:hypothetical protein
MIDRGMRSTRRSDVPSKMFRRKGHKKTRHCTLWPRASGVAMRGWGEYRGARTRAGIYLLFCVGNKSAPESVSSRTEHNNLGDDLPGKCSLAYCSQAFAGLPTFCPITFHLLFSYSLIAENSAAF